MKVSDPEWLHGLATDGVLEPSERIDLLRRPAPPLTEAIPAAPRQRNAADQVASRIRKAIVRGELQPGDKLPHEGALSELYEVSRPTAREAIRILHSEGLIRVARGAGGGARVNYGQDDIVSRAAGVALQLKRATLQDIYEARIEVEAPAARSAAERRPLQAGAALAAHLRHEWAVLDDVEARQVSVAAFHKLLLQESGNPAYSVLGMALHGVVERHFDLAVRTTESLRRTPRLTRERYEQALISKQKLIDLIEAGRGAEADEHWRRYMRSAASGWLNGIASTTVIDIME